MANKAIICPMKGFLMSRTNIFNHCKHLLARCDHTATSSDLYSISLLTHFLFLFLFVGHRPNGTCQPGTGGKDGQMCLYQTNKSSLLVINVPSGPTMAAHSQHVSRDAARYLDLTVSTGMKPRQLAFFWARPGTAYSHQTTRKVQLRLSQSSPRGRLRP